MPEVLLFSVVLAPIILALVELIKKTTGLNVKLVPLLAFVVGIVVGLAAYPFTDLEFGLRLWAGGLAGLSATGLFEIGSKSSEYIKED